MVHLPDLLTFKIVNNLSDSSVFQLVSLAGVCSTWRTFVKELQLTQLVLETSVGLKDQPSWPREWSGEARSHFRKLSVENRTLFYEAATLLLQSHKSVYCSGDSISDSVVINLATKSLQRLTLEDCIQVTDRSLSILLLRCPHLKELRVHNLPQVSGAFLPALLQCKQLRYLSLQNLPDARWELPLEACQGFSTVPGKAAVKHLPLDVHLSNLNPSTILQQLRLRYLSLDSIHLENGAHGFFRSFPRLQFLCVASSAPSVWAAANYCPELREVVLNLSSSVELDDCLAALLSAPSLRTLELSPKSFMLTKEQLRLAGVLNLTELRLESYTFKQQPLSCIGVCHVNNDGIKVLVDTICQRKLYQSEQQPFKLSLSGAAFITHNAVSALLRLPLLSGLSLDGCSRISSIDKMRLIAKVKAGRELLDGTMRRRHEGIETPFLAELRQD